MGNELGGKPEVLEELVVFCRNQDPRHVYTSATCGVLTGNRQYTVAAVHGIRGEDTAHDFRTSTGQTWPLVSHEVGQWTVCPNFAEMGKYAGGLVDHGTSPWSEMTLAAKGMLDAGAPVRRSRRTGMRRCFTRKRCEVLLRTPGPCRGSQLLCGVHN